MTDKVQNQVDINLRFLIRKNGGRMDLSYVKDRYKEEFGSLTPLEAEMQGYSSLKDWFKAVDFLSLTQPPGKKFQWFVSLKESETKLGVHDKLRLLVEEHKQMDISFIKSGYAEKYGERLPCEGSIKKWLGSFPFLLLRQGNNKFQWMVSLNDKRTSNDAVFQNKEAPTSQTITTATESIDAPDPLLADIDPEYPIVPTRIFTNVDDINLDVQLFETRFNLALNWAIHKDEKESIVSMLIIRFATETIAMDCQMTKSDVIADVLRALLNQNRCRTMIHDMFQFKHAMKILKLDIRDINLSNCFDSQLLMEYNTGNCQCSIKEMCGHLGISVTDALCNKPKFPLNPNDMNLKTSVKICSSLWAAAELIASETTKCNLEMVMNASRKRVAMNQRDLRFNLKDNYDLGSIELLIEVVGEAYISKNAKLVVHNEIEDLIDPLPDYMKDHLYALGTDCISDISIDIGRPPCCWNNGKRVFMTRKRSGLLGFNQISVPELVNVEQKDLNQIMGRLGDFGDDNRAGMDRSLHRISCIRNRYNVIIGLTMRVGRHVDGNADMILDLLFKYRDKSILFLGEPGSGKTTIVREVTKLLAENNNVCIVDTSNEIAGGGDVPHRAIGNARRLMVRSLADQSKVMIECVQNHTPETIVIDEIGRPAEVAAARTAKHRGVRIVASAHGDLRNLLKNKELRGILGGLETVTIGDDLALEEARKKGLDEPQKSKTSRAATPVFEIIVELKRGKPNDWKIILDSATAVDSILNNDLYKAEHRTRDPNSGTFHAKNILS